MVDELRGPDLGAARREDRVVVRGIEAACLQRRARRRVEDEDRARLRAARSMFTPAVLAPRGLGCRMTTAQIVTRHGHRESRLVGTEVDVVRVADVLQRNRPERLAAQVEHGDRAVFAIDDVNRVPGYRRNRRAIGRRNRVTTMTGIATMASTRCRRKGT